MENKILIFDFDGTIADSFESTVRIYNEIAKEFNYTEISKENLITLRNKSFLENIRFLGVPLYKLPIIANKVRSKMKAEVPNLKVFKGIKESLVTLKMKGYKLYIVSSNSKENIASFLRHNQISEFDDIYSVTDLFGKHKRIERSLRLNKWNRSSVTYIGDEIRDIDAARQADVSSVAVTWGYNTEKALAKNKPDRILGDPLELGSL